MTIPAKTKFMQFVFGEGDADKKRVMRTTRGVDEDFPHPIVGRRMVAFLTTPEPVTMLHVKGKLWLQMKLSSFRWA